MLFTSRVAVNTAAARPCQTRVHHAQKSLGQAACSAKEFVQLSWVWLKQGQTFCCLTTHSPEVRPHP